MTAEKDHVFYERLRGDEWFDEIRIVTVPRWKESELSGDEWRTSARVEAYRCGRLLAVYSSGDIQAAAALLPGRLLTKAPALQNGPGWHEMEDGETARTWTDDYCFQPGCPDLATIELRLKERWCSAGDRHEYTRPHHRRFCERHKRRGDCGLDDAEDNYEAVALLVDGEWKPLPDEGVR